MEQETANIEQLSSPDISVVTGLFIKNEKGEIWFGRMPKWSDMLSVVGGHVKHGETVQDGALRELKEEVGVDVDDIEYIGYVEIIDSDKFYKPKHFVGFNFIVHVEGRPELLFNEEFTESCWLTREEALKRDDLNPLTRISLNAFDQSVSEVSKKEVEVEVNVDYKDKWLRAQ